MDETKSDRRHPVAPFDPGLLAGIVRDTDIKTVTLCDQGKSNTNYRLQLRGEETLILRLHSQGSGARERAVMDRVSGSVPVPEILASGDGWSLLSFIPGEPLAEHAECTAAAAELLPRIWEHAFPSRGWIEPGGAIVPFDFGDASDFFPAMLRHPDVRRWLGDDIILRLHAIILQDDQSAREEIHPACLVHGDFNPSNILVLNGKVTAVLDWEFAHAGDPFMDIANLLRGTESQHADGIQHGLRRAGFNLPDDWLERCETQHLGSYLEFLTTQRSDDFKRKCVSWIAQFVQNGSFAEDPP